MWQILRKGVVGATLLAVALGAAACGSGDDADGPTIVVATFNFGESLILGEIYAQVLEAEGYAVEKNLGLGSREVVKPALESGEIGLVPEYTGSLGNFLGVIPTADEQSTWQAVKDAFEANGVTLLAYAPAQDKNGFVVTGDTAASLGLSKVSDLAPVAADLVFGGPPECPERLNCLPGLESVYGLTFAEFKPLDVGGPLTVAALDGGDVDVGVLFTTDGVIAAKGFVLLEDDQGLNPAENIVPAVRMDIVEAYGDDFVDLLDSVSAEINTPELTEMNRRAGIDQDDPADIAAQWLADKGFISG
ncbi:MAG: ABC transporter substrate-binding protein [bacterium]|nr:ABC transporter substrate-binding protein [Acidimicrobiia bacterium]MCY4649151.1 ABC transporter substrate-binding protein [bacterium]